MDGRISGKIWLETGASLMGGRSRHLSPSCSLGLGLACSPGGPSMNCAGGMNGRETHADLNGKTAASAFDFSSGARTNDATSPSEA